MNEVPKDWKIVRYNGGMVYRRPPVLKALGTPPLGDLTHRLFSYILE